MEEDQCPVTTPVKPEETQENGTLEAKTVGTPDPEVEPLSNGGEEDRATEAEDASSSPTSKVPKSELNGTVETQEGGSTDLPAVAQDDVAVKTEESVERKSEPSEELSEDASDGKTKSRDGETNSGEGTPTSTPPRRGVKKKKKVTKLSIMHAIAARLSNQGKAVKEESKAEMEGLSNEDETVGDPANVEEKAPKENQGTTEPRPESPSRPADSSTAPAKKAGHSCAVCSAAKGLRYQVLYQGKTQFLCSDACFKAFRNKQKLAPKKANKDRCALCDKDISEGSGFFPSVGECKPLCSESCMKKYSELHGNWRMCAQCERKLAPGDKKFLIWETMEFCGEECLSKYQTTSGSHCSHCNASVPQTSLGKYCVRFGSDIRQFCSGKCLEEFKRGLKVCCLCQKDLSSQTEGFLAPVGDKGHFKDFCSQQCLERYEKINATTSGAAPIKKCSACSKDAPVKYEVELKGEKHSLCKELCVASFRYARGLQSNVCENCHQLYEGNSTVGTKESRTVLHELSPKQFCSKSCVNLFVLSHRKIVPCSWCKVKKYNFDMIERVGDSGAQAQMFCSLNCLSLLRASQSASSSRVVRCDHCGKLQGAQYHLTMSDASIRNFCCYKCVLSFQSQFSNMPTLTTSAPTAAQAANQASNQGKGVSTRNSTPIISSIMSLAPNAAHGVVPTTLQQVDSSTGSLKMPALTPGIKVTVGSSISHSTVTKDALSATMIPKPTITVTPSIAPSQATATSANKDHLPVMAREIIVQFPPPKLVKNKTMQCKPITQSKGIACRPHPFHKETQTELAGDVFKELKGVIPVPVPIYVPVPMHMYTQTVPSPLPFPIPIPVPFFLPTTKNTTEEILETLKQIREHLKNNEVYDEALLNVAHIVTGVPRKGSPTQREEDKTTKESPEEPNLRSLEEYPSKQKGTKRRASESEVEEPAAKVHCASEEEGFVDDYPEFIEPVVLESPTDSLGAQEDEQPDVNYNTLKQAFGVDAWSCWVRNKNKDLEEGSQTGSRRLKLFKTDLLSMTPEELNYSLCLFIKEVHQPTGEPFPPTVIYVQCLGIQQYLYERGRLDNVFSDPQYEMFAGCLDHLFRRALDPTAEPIHRISEEMLWDAKQLGAHSPLVLINTLMYFNVKHFKMYTVKEHMSFSFNSVLRQSRKSEEDHSIRVLRYNGRKKDNSSMTSSEDCEEQIENVENPLRCPVKLYEFYLSKCPSSVKSREDIFYMQPERLCLPDSAVWYTTQSLAEEVVARMLTRFCLVKEVQDMTDSLFKNR